VTALGLLTEDNGHPPKDARKEQRVERVGEGLVRRHEKVARHKAGSEGLTLRTRLAKKEQRRTPARVGT